MASTMQVPELRCIDPENYRQFFRIICWNGIRRSERLYYKRKAKKDRVRRPSPSSTVACYAPSLLANPSQFAVYATVRRSVLARWKHLNGISSDNSDDSDPEESTSQVVPPKKISKITGIGLRTVFSLVSKSRFTNATLCENALEALLDVLQGHAPEELAPESTEIAIHMQKLLIDVATARGADGIHPFSQIPSSVTAVGAACLISLAVTRGEAELILNVVSTLIMDAEPFTAQYIQIPLNLTILQRSVRSIILGSPSRNLWLNYGIPHQSLVTSFPVDLPSALTAGSTELVIRALVSDGCFLYVFTSRGLLKIGSGYGSSIKQHVYLYKPDFFPSDRHGWLGCGRNKLYVRIGRKKPEVYEVDKSTLEIRNLIKLDPGTPAPLESKTAIFSDGVQLGMVMVTENYENLAIRLYDVSKIPEKKDDGDEISLKHRKEIMVPLMRRRTLVFGRAAYEDGMARRGVDLDSTVAMQLDDNEDDPLVGICCGQEFGLLTTASGKVYYTGKGQALGYKAAAPQTARWTLMKETMFNKNEVANLKKFKVVQVAVGHEGMHAVLVLDNGTAMFTGICRRGEDGDNNKHRRAPRPLRAKKIQKADGHHIVQAACNLGSTALVTKQGVLLMFGKDTQHCDEHGVVQGLRHEKVIQVALGRAHAVVLTANAQVYTFGINNKGQCGREFGYTKEKNISREERSRRARRRSISPPPQPCAMGRHEWLTEYCRVCVLCRECTGFGAECNLSNVAERLPGKNCGCGEGDSGCADCGYCRTCAALPTDRLDDDDDTDSSKKDKDSSKNEGPASGSDMERDPGFKVSCLAPARIAIPGAHKVAAVACGLHHSVLLTENGEVFTFGSNQFGQLGAGDIVVHHRIIRVRVPKASSVVAGSNHTAVLTQDGELYTFGFYHKGSLGRPIEEQSNTERAPIWYATARRVPKLGARFSCKAVWVCASGDQTFVRVSQSLIRTDSLFSSTIIANSSTIIILPNQPEHTFKCLTINKADGTCTAWPGSEQVDFVHTLACLDPMYDVIWCYQPQMRVMKCYNILAFDSHKLQRCCNPETDFPDTAESGYPNVGCMKRLEDFKFLENYDVASNCDEQPVDNVALSDISILNQELAIPSTHIACVTRMHAAMHLLGCLDSLTYVHDNKLNMIQCKREPISSSTLPLKAEYLVVTRFENHGGGWGYSGHSVEAIRFMCDTDILVGGFGLFGGRGDYTARIKLFDIGHDGGDQEGDGELIAESDDVIYECPPRDRYPIMFSSPLPVIGSRWYVAWACVSGPSSDCGSAGQAMVINDDVGFHFKTSKKSNNGTDVNAGQIPCIFYKLAGCDNSIPRRMFDSGDPIMSLSRNISRKVTVNCFRHLIDLLGWSWNNLKETILETNGQIPIFYQKLKLMKHQKRLVYVIRACMRIIKSYINQIYPQNNKKRNSNEYMSYFESIGEVKTLIQKIVASETPSCSLLPRRCVKMRTYRVCYVQFALELTNSILKEAHDTITSCFHAFFPTPILKWNHLCTMLCNAKEGIVPDSQIRELTATCASMCASRSLRDVLQYIVPKTPVNFNTEENNRSDSKTAPPKDLLSKSATVPRSSHAQKPPPIPPRTSHRDNQKPSTSKETQPDHFEWHLLDIIPKLLDIVMTPIKQQMMTRQCGQPHDHGEIKQREKVSEYCCKLVVRIVAELSYSAANIREMEGNAVKHLMTPSRFMRMNQSRSWNTGNGSPDAICFTVDRPGVMLVGVCVFSGAGPYEYSLELLHDMRKTNSAVEDPNAANCWVSVETIHGSYLCVDSHYVMVPLHFSKPIRLKEDLRYAIRLCNQGGRTTNGDCGLPSVKGPDGTTFRFASCSLSFNGTTLARGQLPCLVYYGSSRSFVSTCESADVMITTLRAITLRVLSIVLERTVDMFCTLRNELTAEDLRRNVSVLQQSPALNILLPYTLANLEGLNDSKSVIKLLELIHKLLPHVAAMNLLVPTTEEFTTTTTNYSTWVESDHPYRPATVKNTRVLFPPSVSWIVLEMDPRSVTSQPEDTLTIFAVAGTPRQKCHCQSEIRVADPPFRKRLVQLTADGEFEEMEEDPDFENACMHYNSAYVSVTPKLGHIKSEWPQKVLLIPGNEVIFSLETVSDYLTEYNISDSDENRFGFRCLCSGYEDTPLTTQRQGLVALEMELVYAGAACASKLLAPDLDVPPMVFSTLVDVQLHHMNGTTDEDEQDSSEVLLSRGLELSSPLTVHQVIDGQPLLRCVSTERQFLIDFIGNAEGTAGGRLARWLAPTPRVEPSKCEIKGPPSSTTPGAKLAMPILVRDQYGDLVASPSLSVEVVVQKLDSSARHSCISASDCYASRIDVPNTPFTPSNKDNTRFQAITMMKAYNHLSFEELRYVSGTWGEAVSSLANRVPAERIIVRPQQDGFYVLSWTPRVPGIYVFRCTLDNVPISKELTVEVTEPVTDPDLERECVTQPSSPPAKKRRFNVECSAGLRVRASPSLQSEELGKIPTGEDIAFVEEVTNKDGSWVRLNWASVRAYTDGTTPVAWCLQYHRHLETVLLTPIEQKSPQDVVEMDYPGLWTGYKGEEDDSPAVVVPAADAEPQAGPSNDQLEMEDKFPFSIEYDDTEEEERDASPFDFEPEPSKRDRQMRNEAAAGDSPRRRNNGNDAWSPVRHRPDNGVPEMPVDIRQEADMKVYRDFLASAYRDIQGSGGVLYHDRKPRQLPRDINAYKPCEPLRRPHGFTPSPESPAAPQEPDDPGPACANPPPRSPVQNREPRPEPQPRQPIRESHVDSPQERCEHQAPDLVPKPKPQRPETAPRPAASPAPSPRRDPRHRRGVSEPPCNNRESPPPPPLAQRDNKPPVNRDQKPELPHRTWTEPGSSRAPKEPKSTPKRDVILEHESASQSIAYATQTPERKVIPQSELMESESTPTPIGVHKPLLDRVDTPPLTQRQLLKYQLERLEPPNKKHKSLNDLTSSQASPSRDPKLMNDKVEQLLPMPEPMDMSASPEPFSKDLKRSLRVISENANTSTPIKESKIKRQSDHSEKDEVCECPGSRVARATQTYPDPAQENSNQEGRFSPRGVARERLASRSRASHASSPPPPLPARNVPHPPRKHALSPAQAECLRAIFAALLWHEGIVHDAIACAAFLKFHPQLPKQGARVVTRPPHVISPRKQRHSVEVSNAGNYLHIHPSTLETLTRSGEEASSSRVRKPEINDTIREEDGHSAAGDASTSPGVVNVLPPALRALVALWDALYDSDQLSSATDKYKKPAQEPIDEPQIVRDPVETPKSVPEASRKGMEWHAMFRMPSYRAPLLVRCELCGGGMVPPPLAAHMRHMHPGCRAPTTRGYDRFGVYKRADPSPDPAPTDQLNPSTCGQLAQDMSPAYQLWYVFCERCRDKTIRTAAAKQSTKAKSAHNSNDVVDLALVDHHTMKENAVFLLDLASLRNSESLNSSPWHEGRSRSPPTPPGSMWQPAPPFQCLPALGAAPKPVTTDSTARYHSLGRPPPPPVSPLVTPFGGSVGVGTPSRRVHRSVSMGQAGPSDLAHAASPPLRREVQDHPEETLSGAGSSLLAQPSAELQRLVGCGENSGACPVSAFESPRVDPEALMKSPVLTFVLAERDLPLYRQKMDAAVRVNIVRQYAFEAMNWLLRSTTQPTCVHDVMWWFSSALDKYARIDPPPSNQEEYNKENAGMETNRAVVPTASTSAICPGGRAARGSRAAFHAFLGSVSALAPSLQPASPALLQAVRCWALHYSQHDWTFLHRSQVFSVISKILSHSEDGVYDEGMLGTLNESLHSNLNKENYVWSCPDVTGWCDISVSSRQGMAGSLTDGSTETFWESGDEDRNKSRWINVTFPGGNAEDRPHVVCVHIDNTRDTLARTVMISFLYSGSSGETYHMQDIEIDPKAATWICYTLPTCYLGVTSSSLRVRCELRGPESAVRVRQVRVLGAPARHAAPAASPSRLIHSLTEADTLRVFRLLTSQVFGKLLESDQPISESGEVPHEDDAPANDSDLREHVVGILFAGNQLTSLQRQVMSHIVYAIGAEVARVRDDWETALICSETADKSNDVVRPLVHQQDGYCFEMLSLLLALSGSHIGRAHLAQQTEILGNLLALLHTGSDRVQRQVISLLRRMIIEIPPQKMPAVINNSGEHNERVTLLDHLICYLGKAITVQVKVKGSGSQGPGSVMMGSNIATGPNAPWFMRGNVSKNHAQLVAKLIVDMAEEKISPSWGLVTRTALATYVSQLSQVCEEDRRPERCITLPPMWVTLATLCVCEQSHIELLNSGEGREGRSRTENPRSFCVNHDDGVTGALIECRTCGPLCAECDRFLHLSRATKAHQRTICKEEESAIRIDIHEGCGRAKLFWLLLLVDRRTLKGLAEFRGAEGALAESAVEPPGGSGPPGLAGVCRFCGTRGNTGLLAIGNVCADQQCQEHGEEACNRVHDCGHLCGGVRGEVECLPCLLGCAGEAGLRQDADDMCMICFTDPLNAAPAIQLGCGHVFHLHCCKKVLITKWNGPRITFSFSQCPICKEDMSHCTLEELLAPIRRLREEVLRKGLMRLEYEGLAAPGAGPSNAQFDPEKYAMNRYAYYVCHKCDKAYFGGLARCEAESNGAWEPAELVCGACSDVASAKSCPKHGTDFLEYKCRYCCSVAVFFCFGTSHFCNTCHDDFQRVTNIPRHLLPQCPAGPKGEQLPGSAEECPLHVAHPPTGEEFALGCGVCRHAQGF